MASSKSRISDPGQSSSNFSHGSLTNQSGGDVSAITIDGFLRTVAYIPIAAPEPPYLLPRRTAEEVWREIVAGEKTRVCKQEVPDEELITLEDFLAKAGASIEEEDIKVSPPSEQLSGVFSFEMEAMGIGGRKRGSEGMDRAAQQRQKRMIKNRESAARSRERKQAYQLELESLVAKLEEENKGLLKEKAWRTEKQLKQILEKVIPVVEKPKVVRTHRKVRSMEW